jgi:hypothetical protein
MLGCGVAHTPTYTGSPLAIDLFSVDSFLSGATKRYRNVSTVIGWWLLATPAHHYEVNRLGERMERLSSG